MTELITLKHLRESKDFPARQALAQVTSLRAGLKSLKDRGTHDVQLSKVKAEALKAVRADLTLANVKEREKITEMLDRLVENYRRDYDKHRVTTSTG
ncbi:MAG: hypothetical protein AB1798_08490 [Spirochaetota bacterium]